MKNKLFAILVLLLLGCLATSIMYYQPITDAVKNFLTANGAAQTLGQIAAQVEKTISAPPPLRGPLEPQPSLLTIAGVFEATNQHRIDNTFEPLTLNEKLNQAAQAKLHDMFVNQYFEHVSAAGFGPSHWVEAADYAYVAVGENLALGNYTDDAELVRAWMDSPGHRENILNQNYTQIGIAVGRGDFEGRATWLAVQMFGRPLADCPTTDAALHATITTDQAQLLAWDAELKAFGQRLATEKPKGQASQAEVDRYNQLVETYNTLVVSYKQLVETTKQNVSRYNQQVQAFNRCASSS